MARNIDEFANELTQVTAQVIQAANDGAKARALHAAAHKGDAAAVRRAAESMSTQQLQKLKRQLES